MDIRIGSRLQLLQLFTLSAILTLVKTQENGTSYLDERWHITSRNLEQMLHGESRAAPQPEGYIRRLSSSWRVYAKANDINKREKLKKALEGALESIEGRKKKTGIKLAHESVDRIRKAALLLKEFKTMYQLSHSVVNTWKNYQKARQNLVNITKTDEGQDILQRYLALRNVVLNSSENRTKKSVVPHSETLQYIRKQSIYGSRFKGFLDKTQNHGRDAIAFRQKVSKHNDVYKKRREKEDNKAYKRDHVGTHLDIVDDSLPYAGKKEQEIPLGTEDKSGYTKALDKQSSLEANLASLALHRAKEVVVADLKESTKNNVMTADKKSSVEHQEGYIDKVPSKDVLPQSLSSVITQAGATKVRHAPPNASFHVMSVMASLLESGEKASSPITKLHIAPKNTTAVETSSSRLITGTKIPIVSGATLILRKEEKPSNTTAAKENYRPKASQEQHGDKLPNTINKFKVMNESQARRNLPHKHENKSRRVTFQLTEEQKNEAKKVPIIKLSDMKRLSGTSQTNEEAEISDPNLSYATAMHGVDRQLEAFQRLQEAKKARRRFEVAKQEFDDKMRELIMMTAFYREKDSKIRGTSPIASAVSDEVPRDQVSTGDSHPGIALAGLLKGSPNFSLSGNEAGDDHRGFTLGMLDTVRGENKQHEIKLPEDGAGNVAKVYEVDLPKEFTLDGGKETSSKLHSDSKEDDDATLKALTDAIKEDLTELQKGDVEEKKKKEEGKIKESVAISSIVKQFVRNEKSNEQFKPTRSNQGEPTKPKEIHETSAPVQSSDDNSKGDDAFKEVEDYLSKALDDIAKQTTDNTSDKSNNKATDSKSEPQKTMGLSSTTAKTKQENEGGKHQGTVDEVQSSSNLTVPKTPVHGSPTPKQADTKPTLSQIKEIGTTSTQSTAAKVVSADDSKTSATGDEKDPKTATSTKGKDEEKDKENLLKEVMERMEQFAKDPVDIHSLHKQTDSDKSKAEVADHTTLPVMESKIDDHIARPGEDKATKIPNIEKQLKADLDKIDKDDQSGNQKTLQKAQKLEDEVAKQQEKLYTAVSGKNDDPYKTINEGTKPLFEGNEIDPEEKKEAEERLKETELEREGALKDDSKTVEPLINHHSHRHHHRRHHHRHHHPYKEDTKEEDEEDEEDNQDDGRDDIREDADDDEREEPREEAYENYDDEDDADDTERDDEDDEEEDDEDDKKSRVFHYQGLDTIPYGATINRQTLYHYGSPAREKNFVQAVQPFKPSQINSKMSYRNTIDFVPSINRQSPQIFQNSISPLFSTSLYKKDVPYKPEVTRRSKPFYKPPNTRTGKDSDITESDPNREELEDKKRSIVPRKIRYLS